ncbi:hypothetical protein CSV60_12785 [Sporosarcina sp. P7]|nr:hypothetical protein CSV60_12785 [Sporosarcina sp. P7]
MLPLFFCAVFEHEIIFKMSIFIQKALYIVSEVVYGYHLHAMEEEFRMKLVINEQPLQLLPSLVHLVGLHEALFLQ